MYESRHKPVASRKAFVRRLTRNIFISIALSAGSLFMGMAGYVYFEQMSWVDAYVNASMILSGMGPVSHAHTVEGKIFSGSYALFSGIIFLIVIAVVLFPLIHRFFHKFLVKD